MRIVIAGGTGALGRRIGALFQDEHEIVILTRSPRPDAEFRMVVSTSRSMGNYLLEEVILLSDRTEGTTKVLWITIGVIVAVAVVVGLVMYSGGGGASGGGAPGY